MVRGVEKWVFGVFLEGWVHLASLQHEGAEVGLVFAWHVVPAPSVAIEVSALHGGVAVEFAVYASYAEVAYVIGKFAQVGVGEHGVEVAYDVYVAVECAVGRYESCVVGVGSYLVSGTEGAECGYGCDDLLCGGWAHDFVSVVVPEEAVGGEVPDGYACIEVCGIWPRHRCNQGC